MTDAKVPSQEAVEVIDRWLLMPLAGGPLLVGERNHLSRLVDAALLAERERAWKRGWSDCEKYHVDDGPDGPDYEEYMEAALAGKGPPIDRALAQPETKGGKG